MEGRESKGRGGRVTYPSLHSLDSVDLTKSMFLNSHSQKVTF